MLAGWRSDIVVSGGHRAHPDLAARLPEETTLRFEKYAAGVKLPGWPRQIRRSWQKHLFKDSKADVVVIWNQPGRGTVNAIKAIGPENCIYWEHGSTWLSGGEAARKWVFDHIDNTLAISHAAKRMLELRWGYSGEVHIVPNALRTALCPVEFTPRAAPKNAWRLGVAARLIPIKGVAVALQAVALLHTQGYPVTLDIAGDGEDRERLSALATRLGIEKQVRFLGMLAHMQDFYKNIDLLIHPPLYEPFGLVSIEAQAYGIPAVVTAVDGLVEAVADGVSGRCVAPTEKLSVYSGLGGRNEGMPPYVYHPNEDGIDRPRVVAPDALAQGIVEVMGNEARYEKLSRGAVERARNVFDFDRHVLSVVEAVDACIQS